MKHWAPSSVNHGVYEQEWSGRWRKKYSVTFRCVLNYVCPGLSQAGKDFNFSHSLSTAVLASRMKIASFPSQTSQALSRKQLIRWSPPFPPLPPPPRARRPRAFIAVSASSPPPGHLQRWADAPHRVGNRTRILFRRGGSCFCGSSRAPALW